MPTSQKRGPEGSLSGLRAIRTGECRACRDGRRAVRSLVALGVFVVRQGGQGAIAFEA